MSGKKFRVLLAETAPGEAEDSLRIIYPASESKLELTTVSTIPTLLATIELAEPETIFLDLSLCGADPLEAVRRVHRAAPGIPLIVLADAANKSLAARSTSEGAIDYLLKGFMDARTLGRVLRSALERNTLDGLADLLRDRHTGLYNREGFTTLGTRAMETAMRSGGTLVLLCALIENNSAPLENLSSLDRERAVCETAELIAECFRRNDFLARLGDVQFAALAVDAAEPSARVLRQRVESRLAIHNRNRQPWGPLVLRFSVGYWGANDGRSFPEFLDAVELELRQPGVLLRQVATQRENTAAHQ
jgi:PleD family two-component response regulator